MERKLILFLLLCLCVWGGRAQAVCPSDSLSADVWATDTLAVDSAASDVAWEEEPAKKVFHPRQLIFPAATLAVGSVLAATRWGDKVDNKVRDALHYRHHKIKADDYVQYLPVLSVYGLSLLGAPAKHDYLERTVIAATSYLTLAVVVNGVKYAAKVRRPDSSTRNSFPSGHTSIAFCGAELVRQEYGTWYGVAAYTVATAVGVARIYNDRHWLSDVLAGAGVGVLSARVGYWLFPYTQKLLKVKKGHAASVVPFYDGRGGGMALSYRF